MKIDESQEKTFSAATLGQSVAAVDSEIGAGDVPRGIAQEEGDRAHEILRRAHLSDGDQRGPLVFEVGVFVEDLAGSVGAALADT